MRRRRNNLSAQESVVSHHFPCFLLYTEPNYIGFNYCLVCRCGFLHLYEAYTNMMNELWFDMF